MPTPRAAVHRDLEGRFRSIEQRLRDLTSAALRRDQLGVSSGDFVVSGGGSVIVHDGGSITTENGSGNRIRMRDDGSQGVLEFFSGAAGETPGIINPANNGPIGHSIDILTSKAAAPFDQPAEVVLNGSSATSKPQLILVSPTELYAPNGGQLGGAWTVDGDVVVNGHLDLPAPPTTSNAANVNLNTSTGRIRLVSSSLRYKQDVETAQVDTDAVLGLEGRTWRDKTEVAEDPDTERRHVGFIAEELDDAGLTEYVEYDDQGRPESIAYDRLTVPLLAVVKQQAEQVAALTERLDALEERHRQQMDALEARMQTQCDTLTTALDGITQRLDSITGHLGRVLS